MRRFVTVWRNTFRRDRLERDLDDEMRAVLDELVAEKIRGGMGEDEARRAAHIEIGGVESVKASVREIRAGAWLQAIAQDARYAARLLRRNPIFTVTATLSLAIGIGATTTIFTVANGLLLRPAPGVADPAALVDIYQTEEGLISNPTLLYSTYLDVRERTTTLRDSFAYEPTLRAMSLSGPDGAVRVFGGLASANYFSVLGVRAAAGRLFDPADGEESASAVAVLSHAFWVSHFSGDRAVVGKVVRLNGAPFTVIGVASEEFRGSTLTAPEVWMPAAKVKAIDPRAESRWLQVLVGGRLKDGVGVRQAAAEVAVIGSSVALGPPGPGRDVNGALVPMTRSGLGLSGSSPIPGSLRLAVGAFLVVLMTLVSLVLVIACTNLAGVLLARATVRRREIAVRLAVGVGRARLVRQLLTETLLLFLLGAAAGLIVARGATSLVPLLLPSFEQPIALSLALDGRVVAFALCLALVAAVLSGLTPALQATRADVMSSLKDTVQAPHKRLRMRNAFVVTQLALSMLLVLATGLFAERLQSVSAVDQGFDPKHLQQASMDLSMAGYTDANGRSFVRELLGRVRELPGVAMATLADTVPTPGRGMAMAGDLIVPGVVPPSGQPAFSANWNIVEPGYFDTIRMRLLEGRNFTDAERTGGQQVVIVSESTARRLWPGQRAIGKTVVWRRVRPDGSRTPVDLVVVGVVRDLGGARRDAPGLPFLPMYVPMQQRYTPRVTILARSTLDRSLAPEIRQLVASLNPNLPLLSVGSVEDELIGPEQLQLRIAAVVSATVGLVGVFLAAIGVYGVTAYAVSQRTREIGVRLALGADRGAVVGLVLRQGMGLVAIGSVIGLGLAAAARRLLAGQLFGIAPLGWATAAGAVLLFALVGLAACYVPTWRASRINALEALRYE